MRYTIVHNYARPSAEFPTLDSCSSRVARRSGFCRELLCKPRPCMREDLALEALFAREGDEAALERTDGREQILARFHVGRLRSWRFSWRLGLTRAACAAAHPAGRARRRALAAGKGPERSDLRGRGRERGDEREGPSFETEFAGRAAGVLDVGAARWPWRRRRWRRRTTWRHCQS